MILLLAPPSAERENLSAFLIQRGHLVTVMEASAAAPARIARSGVDTIVVDLAAPDGLKFIRRYASQPHRVPIICLADRRKREAASDALRLGAFDVIARPLRPDDVVAAIANSRELGLVRERNVPAPQIPETINDAIFGVSPAMGDVLSLVARVAPIRCTVLLVGERGTGRETVARVIHARGPRRDNPFVKVQCSATTAADITRVADEAVRKSATVYLENLGELPADVQGRLATLLQTQDSTAPPPADGGARFIASALPRLGQLVERGGIRGDLVEALATVRIDMPPLRQRPGDVPLLAIHFLKEACRRNEVPAKTFSPSALLVLAGMPWRGNASELRSLCERLAVVVPRGVVLIEDVLSSVRFETAETIARRDETLREARERFERDYVAAVLAQHRGRIGAAAQQLGIERTNLYRKIKQLRIRVPGPGEKAGE